MTPITSIEVTTTKIVEVEDTKTYRTEMNNGLRYAAMFDTGFQPMVVALFDNLHWAKRFIQHAELFKIMDITTGKYVD